MVNYNFSFWNRILRTLIRLEKTFDFNFDLFIVDFFQFQNWKNDLNGWVPQHIIYIIIYFILFIRTIDILLKCWKRTTPVSFVLVEGHPLIENSETLSYDDIESLFTIHRIFRFIISIDRMYFNFRNVFAFVSKIILITSPF